MAEPIDDTIPWLTALADWERKNGTLAALMPHEYEAIGKLIHGVAAKNTTKSPRTILSEINPPVVKGVASALEPFATFADENVDSEGWTSSTQRERIVDWFGPSQFRAAQEAFDVITGDDFKKALDIGDIQAIREALK